MKQKQLAGFCEIEHTADWRLQAWAPDLIGLLEQAARGMYSLAGVQLQPAPRQTRQFSLPASDLERLLVAFLSELLWLSEQESLGFDVFNLQVKQNILQAHLEGAPIKAMLKEIKAVTYHGLTIQQASDRVQAEIIFDV